MKLNSLRALVSAIDDGSIRSAAKRLGLSQPALTKAIKELEVELGAALLVRTSTGVQPSAQGQLLYEHACRVIRELESAVGQINQMSGRMQGQLSVGAVPLAVMLLIPETIRTFNKAFPDIHLRISEELYIEQLQRLRRAEVDVVVGGAPEGLASGEFTIEPLIQTTMVVVTRCGGKWSKASSLKELSQAKWIYTGASSNEGYATLLYRRHGQTPPPVGAIINSTLALLSLLASGDFVGLMPEQMMHHPLAKDFLDVIDIQEKGLVLNVGAIVRRDSLVSPAVRQFVNHLHRAAAQLKLGTEVHLTKATALDVA
jgi:LysR family transcriptional regulator, regulator of abg operon